jgi:hypothetical protein
MLLLKMAVILKNHFLNFLSMIAMICMMIMINQYHKNHDHHKNHLQIVIIKQQRFSKKCYC